jgi:transposase
MEIVGLDELDDLLEGPFFVFVEFGDEHSLVLPNVGRDGALHCGCDCDCGVECRVEKDRQLERAREAQVLVQVAPVKDCKSHGATRAVSPYRPRKLI